MKKYIAVITFAAVALIVAFVGYARTRNITMVSNTPDLTSTSTEDVMTTETSEEIVPTSVVSVATTTVKKPIPVAIKTVDLRTKLTAQQYYVTQENGTEPAYNNEYWDNHEAGIYVDVVSGVALFSSTDKYDSHTGWPSFTKPIDASSVTLKSDMSFGTERTEVRSAASNSHLGHLFNDGPQPLGTRYCMNSAALRFIAKADLEKEGYGKYISLFR